MHSECPIPMPCDKLSPRPSPQHSKSLTAPLDCTNCSKQHSNPINSFISKWKYKEDLAKPLNMKKTRPRKQPQTTYHFPLSHTSVNTFNPNNKQNETNETTTPSSPDSTSPTDSPREISPRDPSPRERSPRTPITNLSPRSPSSPRSPTSPRSATRDILLKHQRAQLQQRQEREEAQHHQHYQQDHPMTPAYQRQYENTHDGQSYDYHMISPKKHRRTLSSPDPSAPTTEMPAICNPAYESPYSPHSSDDNDDSYSSDPSPYTGKAAARDSRKRRSSEKSMETETIEISDSESEYVTLSTPQYHNAHTFHSRRLAPLDPPSSPRADSISLRPLSLNSNDLAKYHLEAPPPRSSSPTLPPLNFARLPSIDEICWPMDESNSRIQHENVVRHRPRGQSFPCHYT